MSDTGRWYRRRSTPKASSGTLTTTDTIATRSNSETRIADRAAGYYKCASVNKTLPRAKAALPITAPIIRRPG